MSLQVKNLDYQIGGKSILEQICLEVTGRRICRSGRTERLRQIYASQKYLPDLQAGPGYRFSE